MDKSVLIESHYLPCVKYFALISSGNKILLDVNENYVKQSYRNRTYILGPNKILPLSVPIHRGSGKVLTKDVKIAYNSRWQNNHWRSISSAYGKTPFYFHFAEDIRRIIYQHFRFLIDLNLALLTKCLELLQRKHSVDFWPDAASDVDTTDIIDCRNQVSLKSATSENCQFVPIKYTQAFGKDFVPNLSVLDLLFCEGPQAENIILRSIA